MNKSNKKYWLKRKRYGYGWMPSTWQGWAVNTAFLLLIAAGTVMLQDAPRNEFSAQLAWYLAYVFVLTVILFAVSWLKGPVPKWRWGKKPNDSPNEDQ